MESLPPGVFWLLAAASYATTHIPWWTPPALTGAGLIGIGLALRRWT